MNTMVDPKMVGKLLIRAAEIVEAGWCRGAICLDGITGLNKDVRLAVVGVDSFCMEGAVIRAKKDLFGDACYSPAAAATVAAVYEAAIQFLPAPSARALDGRSLYDTTIPHFNDWHCYDGDEAGQVFRQAAGDLA